MSDRAILIALLALAAPVGAAVYSALGNDLFLARNLISSLPAIALAFAAMLMALPRVLAATAVALAVAGLGFGAVATFEQEAQRPPYADVGAFLGSYSRPGDVVVEVNLWNGPLGQALVMQLDPDLPLYKLRDEADAVRAAEESGGRILLVRPDIDGLRVGPTGLMRGFRVVDRRTWDGFFGLTVVVYEPR